MRLWSMRKGFLFHDFEVTVCASMHSDWSFYGLGTAVFYYAVAGLLLYFFLQKVYYSTSLGRACYLSKKKFIILRLRVDSSVVFFKGSLFYLMCFMVVPLWCKVLSFSVNGLISLLFDSKGFITIQAVFYFLSFDAKCLSIYG